MIGESLVEGVIIMRRIFMLAMSYLLVGAGLFGVGGVAAFFSVQTFSSSAHTATSPAFVRVIHASPDVGTADVFVDGAKLLSSFAFGAVTGYVPVPPGPHKVQIALVGKGIGGAAITQTLAVSPGYAYTVAAIGTQQSGLSLEVFVDSNLLSPGTVKFRVYQLSPDGGSVSVVARGNMLLNGVGYQNASNYLSIAAGAYTFQVASPGNNTTLSDATTLTANTVASLFLVGMFNGTPKSALVNSQAPGVPGVPNTGSDPVVQGDGALPLAPWSWPLGLASLLFIGSGIFLRRVTAKR
jgi:hypothetical protein